MISEELHEETELEKYLFSRTRTQKGAGEFNVWLKSKQGRVSASELSEYATTHGKWIAKVNFYGTILRTYLNLGLVSKQLGVDSTTRKIRPHYFAVMQPISSRAPAKPSVLHWAFQIGRKWNELFFQSEPKPQDVTS